MNEIVLIEPHPELAKKLRDDTFYVVLTERNDSHDIWEKYSVEAAKLFGVSHDEKGRVDYQIHEKRVELKLDSGGHGWTIGNIAEDPEMPVCLSLMWATIAPIGSDKSRRVLMAYPTSRFVDYTMIEQWLAKYCGAPTVDFENIFRMLDAVNESIKMETADAIWPFPHAA